MLGGSRAIRSAATPKAPVPKRAIRFTRTSSTSGPVSFRRSCTTADAAAMRRDETVDMVAAKGPISVTPATKGFMCWVRT